MGIFGFCGFSRLKEIASDTPDEVHLKRTSSPPTETHVTKTKDGSAAETLTNEAVPATSQDFKSTTQSPEVDPTKKLLDKKTSFSTLTAWQILAYNVVNSSELAAIPEETEHELPLPPPLPSPPKIGNVAHQWNTEKIETHYELLDQLGFGAFGRVYKAKRRSDGALACVKIINFPGASEAVAEEVSTQRALRHPHICCLYGAYCDIEQRTAIAMELCAGGDLEKWLKHRISGSSGGGGNNSSNNHFLSEAEIMHCFVQVLIALQHVHAHGILHRDIKTSNIFLSTCDTLDTPGSAEENSASSVGNGTTTISPTDHPLSTSILDYLLKLGDFGIAKSLNPGQSCAKTMVGTPCYFSPELISDKPYDKKSDVWAAGCVLYELCTLKRPFQGNSVSAVCVKILAGAAPPLPATCSPEIVKLVELLLTKDPRKRPSINTVLAMPFVQKYVDIYEKWRKDRGLASIEEERLKMNGIDQEWGRPENACQSDVSQFPHLQQKPTTYPDSASTSITTALTIQENTNSSTSQDRKLEAVTVVQRVFNKVVTRTGSWGHIQKRRQAEGECREELEGDNEGEVQYVFAS